MRISPALAFMLSASILLSGCTHNGIYVTPTPPTGLETQETVGLLETVHTAPATLPMETTAPATQPETLPPETTLPVTVPTQTAPPETIPAATTPTVTTPPETTVPITVPPVTVPTETIPPETTPPETTFPATIPTETKPAATAPPETTLPVTAPPETTLPATVPTQAVPPETTPSETMPPETEASSQPSEETTPTVPNSDVLRPDPYDVNSFEISPKEQSLLDQICAMRTEKGLPPLIQDTSLCALAYIRAYEAYSHLSHSRPNGDSYTSVFTDYGYGYTVSQEVYARTDLITTTEEILWIWLEGTSTSSKLTDPELSHAGIGIYKKNSYVIVVCLLTAK